MKARNPIDNPQCITKSVLSCVPLELRVHCRHHIDTFLTFGRQRPPRRRERVRVANLSSGFADAAARAVLPNCSADTIVVVRSRRTTCASLFSAFSGLFVAACAVGWGGIVLHGFAAKKSAAIF